MELRLRGGGDEREDAEAAAAAADANGATDDDAAGGDDDDDDDDGGAAAVRVLFGMSTMIAESSHVNATTPTRPILNGEAEAEGEEDGKEEE